MSPYLWMAVLMLALYGLVTAVLDVVAWLGARNAQGPAVSLVSILVLVRDCEEIVERFLRRVCSIGISGSSLPYEVIAVDNYSSDQTWSIIHRLSSSVKTLKAIRMSDVSDPDECAESIGLFMCSGDIAIVCRLASGADEAALAAALRTMLNKPRRERPAVLLGS